MSNRDRGSRDYETEEPVSTGPTEATMRISIINGGGIVKTSGNLFRVLLVLAIFAQGVLITHHANDALGQVHRTQVQ
jgi:hypothetical protein